MLVSLQPVLEVGGQQDTVGTYSVRGVPRTFGLSIDDLTLQTDAHVVVFIPSLDGDGLEDAVCLREQAETISAITGDRVIVTLPFVLQEAGNADALRIAEAIREDMKVRGHKPPQETFALYLELHEVGDGSTDIVGFVRILPKLDARVVRELADAWRDAAANLARADESTTAGAFYRAVHGGLLPGRVDWIMGLMQAFEWINALKKWLSLFSTRG
jgi:hypothetical protein